MFSVSTRHSYLFRTVSPIINGEHFLVKMIIQLKIFSWCHCLYLIFMSSDQKTFIVCLSFTNLYPRKPPTLQSREYLPEGRTMAGDLQRYHPSGDISHQNNSFYLDPLLTSGERSRQADLTVQSPVQHSCLCFVQNCGHLDCARPTASTITTQRGFFF